MPVGAVCSDRHSWNTSFPELTGFLPSYPECLTGTVGTLLLENPLGQNGLSHQGLVYEAAKVFGLRNRRLKLFLNETQTQGEAAVTVRLFLLRKEILVPVTAHVSSVEMFCTFVLFCLIWKINQKLAII